MARSPEQFEAMRNRTKAKLIKAARELFAEYGYGSTTIRMIAQRAKVAIGGMYPYFANKHELLAAVVDQLCTEMEETIVVNRTRVAQLESAEQFVDEYVAVYKRELDSLRLLMSLLLQKDIEDSSQQRVMEMHKKLCDANVFGGTLDGRNNEFVARLNSAMVYFCLDSNENVLEMQMEAVKRDLDLAYAAAQ